MQITRELLDSVISKMSDDSHKNHETIGVCELCLTVQQTSMELRQCLAVTLVELVQTSGADEAAIALLCMGYRIGRRESIELPKADRV